MQTTSANLVLDLGTGALQSLSCFIDPTAINAIVISHFHPDHFMDLVQLRYVVALTYGARAIDVYLPPSGSERLAQLAQSFPSGSPTPFFEGWLTLHDYDPQSVLTFGDVRMTFAAACHYIEAYAVRLTDGDATAAYSADTAPCSAVTELAREADLFLCEAALGANAEERSAPRGHSNAKEAGAMARDARVQHLVLTHYGAGSEAQALRAAAAQTFAGRITVADDGMVFEI